MSAEAVAVCDAPGRLRFDQLGYAPRYGYSPAWIPVGTVLYTIPDDVLRDAARYRFLRDNNAYMRPCYEQRRGFRSTSTDAVREQWDEFVGWMYSDLPITTEELPTMDEAIDYAMNLQEKKDV